MDDVLICMPTRSTPDPMALRCMFNAAIAAGVPPKNVFFPPGAPRDWNRNRIAQGLVDDSSKQWLLFIDDDTTVPEDVLEQLFDVARMPDRPIVTAVQPLWFNHIALVNVCTALPDKARPSQWLNWLMWNPEADPFEVQACGFGCILLNRLVFETIPYPWFVEDYGDVYGRNNVTEDIDFCHKVRDHGFHIWCQPSAVCGHYKRIDVRTVIPRTMVDVRGEITAEELARRAAEREKK